MLQNSDPNAQKKMHWNANLSGSGCNHFWQNVPNNWRQAKPAGEFQKQPISRESRNTGGGGWTEAGPNLAGWNLCPRLWGEMCWAHYLFLKQILQPTLTPSGLRLSSPSQPAESCLVCSGPGWGCPGTACALRGALRARLLNHFSLHPSPFHSLSCADGAILVMLCQCLLFWDQI